MNVLDEANQALTIRVNELSREVERLRDWQNRAWPLIASWYEWSHASADEVQALLKEADR